MLHHENDTLHKYNIYVWLGTILNENFEDKNKWCVQPRSLRWYVEIVYLRVKYIVTNNTCVCVTKWLSRFSGSMENTHNRLSWEVSVVHVGFLSFTITIMREGTNFHLIKSLLPQFYFCLKYLLYFTWIILSYSNVIKPISFSDAYW